MLRNRMKIDTLENCGTELDDETINNKTTFTDFDDPSEFTIKQEPQENSNSDKITGYEEFVDSIQNAQNSLSWETNWNIYKQKNGVCFYRLKSDEKFNNVTMSYKILFSEDMRVKIYENESEADITELNWILNHSKLELWSQFHNMLDFYQTEPPTQSISNPLHHIKQALESLDKVEDPKLLDSLLSSIKQQLSSVVCEANPIYIAVEAEEVIEELKSEAEPEVILDEIKSEFDVTEESSVDEDFVITSKRRKTRRSKERPAKKAKLVKVKRKPGPKPKPKIEGEIFNCEQCEKICDTKIQLKNHFYKKHFGSFICEKCGKVLPSRSAFHDHMARHDENSRVKCPQCDDMMLRESLRRHIRVRHEGYKPFACSVCGKQFSSTTLVKEHEKIHSKNLLASVLEGEKLLYECPKCKKRFERGGKVFEAHVDRCHGILIEKKRSYRYPCPECNKNFITKIACADHMLEVHRIQIGNVEKFCFICKAEFEDPKSHARSHHCEFQCPQCGLQFMSQTKLGNHIANHETGEDRPFVCDACPMKFKTSNHLQSHKKTVHVTDEEKKFVCHVCNKRFAFQYMLTTHLKQSHSDVKRYACSFCNMKFKKLDAMKNHCKIDHGEENAYRCPDCSETLKTLNDLKNHRQSMHDTVMNAQKYHES